ncbi:uncharacterized protein CC84DRAFT_1222411 [Paraphaeosphaeria sporulosa]|uniref:F-box domain-containing protein n=1 Tax=Paraphaeosphaeria sporulosa TaxID=1460663 RepID=A0A177C0F1_9PLEO|nr:uncharacterized protein CC84DRAFT_1222411 [Paraphaeosphaeria sporulosa]OAG00090.1 hypothetical protein CC84DRAFT_1222411 [Paraphaeosphaeria sporulosa]
MVVLVDLDDPDDDGFTPGPAAAADDGRPNPNVNGFSAALSCYPIARQLARQLDLNSLHDLSRTCRQFRANLLEYRDQLIRHTLHCDFDVEDEAIPRPTGSRLLTSGRVARCARDMVAECQRCAAVVCRNCTIKPPPAPTLRARHRRLCRTCTRAPLAFLTAAPRPRASSESSLPGTPDSPRPALLDDAADAPRAFTAPAFERTPCICADTVWLCQPCGQHLKNADTMYVRAWTWRTRYSHYLGGVGTGAGEGNEGVECGRGAQCLAARVVEHEVDCNASDPAYSGSPETGERWTGTSYYAQEIEGIGGVVKMKLKKQVRVGECVKVYEDERDKSIRWLEREVSGRLRSWCSWCERVVLGDKDRAEVRGGRAPSSAGSEA